MSMNLVYSLEMADVGLPCCFKSISLYGNNNFLFIFQILLKHDRLWTKWSVMLLNFWLIPARGRGNSHLLHHHGNNPAECAFSFPIPNGGKDEKAHRL